MLPEISRINLYLAGHFTGRTALCADVQINLGMAHRRGLGDARRIRHNHSQAHRRASRITLCRQANAGSVGDYRQEDILALFDA